MKPMPMSRQKIALLNHVSSYGLDLTCYVSNRLDKEISAGDFVWPKILYPAHSQPHFWKIKHPTRVLALIQGSLAQKPSSGYDNHRTRRYDRRKRLVDSRKSGRRNPGDNFKNQRNSLVKASSRRAYHQISAHLPIMDTRLSGDPLYPAREKTHALLLTA